MPPPVKVQFVAAGLQELDAAFASVSKRLRELQSLQNATSRRGNRTTTQEGVAKAEVKAQADAQKQLESIEQKKLKASERIAASMRRLRERELKREEDDIIRSAERITRAEEKAARERTKIAAKAQKDREKYIRDRVTGPLGRAAGSTMGTVRNIGGSIVAGFGAYGLTSGITSAMDNQHTAAILANQANQHKTGVHAYSADELTRMAGSMPGVSTKEGLAALNQVQSIGGVGPDGVAALDVFKQALADIGKTAIATGVSMEDMGEIFATSFAFGERDASKMEAEIRKLAALAKAGGMNMPQFVKEMSSLSSSGVRFGKGGVMEAAGLAQLIKPGVGSAEETTTAVGAMIREFSESKNLKALRGAGIEPFLKDTQGRETSMKPMAELMPQVLDLIGSGKSVGEMGKGAELMSSLFGQRAIRGVQFLQAKYNEAGGGSAGHAAVAGAIRGSQAPDMTSAQRDEEFKGVAATAEFQLVEAHKAFNAEIGKLLPKFTALIPTLTDLVTGFAKLTAWVIENPFAGIGALFALNLTKEIAAANLSGVLVKVLAGPASAAGTAIGGMANGVAIITAALVTAAAAIAAIDWYDAANKKEGKGERAQAFEGLNRAKELRNKLRQDLSPEARAQAEAQIKEQTSSALSLATNLATPTADVFGGRSSQAAGANRAAQETLSILTQLNASLSKTATAMDGVAGSANAVAGVKDFMARLGMPMSVGANP